MMTRWRAGAVASIVLGGLLGFGAACGRTNRAAPVTVVRTAGPMQEHEAVPPPMLAASSAAEAPAALGAAKRLAGDGVGLGAVGTFAAGDDSPRTPGNEGARSGRGRG